MELLLQNKTTLLDGTKRYKIKLKNAEKIYLGYFLESFEGMCNYTTSDRTKSEFEVTVPPDYEKCFEELFSFLQAWEL